VTFVPASDLPPSLASKTGASAFAQISTTRFGGTGKVAAAFGVGAGWRHTNRHGTFRSDLPPFSTAAVEQTLSNAVLATTIGFDGAVVVSPRTALLWTGRFHVLNDDDREPSGVVRRGVGSTIFRFGGGARLRL
jgi:hypothetical protein